MPFGHNELPFKYSPQKDISIMTVMFLLLTMCLFSTKTEKEENWQE